MRQTRPGKHVAMYALLASALWTSSACVDEWTTTVDCGNGLRCPTGLSCAANQCVCISDTCGDGCSGNCRELERCGDGVLDQYEICEDGDGCSADCVSDESCGNGYRDLAEVCDDGNTVSDDSVARIARCSSTAVTGCATRARSATTATPRAATAAARIACRRRSAATVTPTSARSATPRAPRPRATQTARCRCGGRAAQPARGRVLRSRHEHAAVRRGLQRARGRRRVLQRERRGRGRRAHRAMRRRRGQ